MSIPDDKPRLYPMRVVTRRTGLSPDVLRVWERRYGVVKPTRSGGGQRMYTDADLDRLMLLSRLVRAGHRIAMIARQDAAELARLETRDDGAAGTRGDERADAVVAQAMDAVSRFDDVGLGQALRRSALGWPATEWVDVVLRPFLTQVGERWHQGTMSPAHEHLASATVRDVLAWVLASLAPAAGAPLMLMATPAGEMHEFGAMMAAVVAAQSGWRVKYLGPNLPAGVLAECARDTGASVVGLSIVHASDDAILDELRELRRALPGSVHVVAGGRGAGAHASSLAAIDVATPADASEWRAHLDELRTD